MQDKGHPNKSVHECSTEAYIQVFPALREGYFYIYFVEIISRIIRKGETVMTDGKRSCIIEMSHISNDVGTVIFKLQRERIKKHHEV